VSTPPSRPSNAGAEPEWRPATAQRPALQIVRSVRRRRSVSARFVTDRIVVRLPAGIDAHDEEPMIDSIVAKVVRQHRADRVADDRALLRRAHRLADRHLDGVRPASVTWSTRMRTLHGSCSVADGRIRLSVDLAQHPDWVLDAVLMHELAHLIEPNHSPAFHALANRYPDQRRAQAYLDGFQAGRFARARADDDTPTAADPPLSGESGGPGS
jgi:hypothetical protein